MDRLPTLWSKALLIICKACVKALARMYAKCKENASVNFGVYEVTFETYCIPIEDLCREYQIQIPEYKSKSASKFSRWLISWKYGWPLPVRCVWLKGKQLEEITSANSPNELAIIAQAIWNKAIRQTIDKKKLNAQSKTCRSAESSATNKPKISTVNVKSLPKVQIIRHSPLESQSTKSKPFFEGTNQENIRTIQGAVIDNSF